MVKTIILPTLFFLFTVQVNKASAQGGQSKPEAPKASPKFLDDITLQPAAEEPVYISKPAAVPSVKKDLLMAAAKSEGNVESAQALQFKYSLLLDVEVELVKNINLFWMIDEWYGVRYQYGGSTKSGIDCSALMQILFTSTYGISLPRTAKMQYDASRRISRTELKEGDLLFFNTRGGVSHVGMYLANNKFVHASVKGVTVSDMFESYYAGRLIGVGRVLEDVQPTATASLTP